jgi:DNA mismatch repair protein MutL
MGHIRLLSKSVSDKIAAGEVVERPLSVVKELVENAIDAGASAVSVNIADGGIGEVCVTDNGSGIPADEVELAFQKHATSKIYSEHDLGFISTQGFRGEALSSIAAVSVVDMKTKTKDSDAGTHVRISGSRVDSISPAGLPDGTAVCVRQLFFNVPVRRKFLKKPAQEAAYISDLMSRYILAFPEISFHYTSNGKTIYHSPGNGRLKDAIYSVYGGDVLDNITYVAHTVGDIAVSGYVSRPGTAMKYRRAGSVFVNNRYIRSSLLHDMVKDAYGSTMVKGETPFFLLNISLPPSAVDVNVHPNKMQVRFENSAAVEHVIKEAVATACTSIRGSVALAASVKQERHPIEMLQPQEITQTDLFTGFHRKVFKEDTVLSDNKNVYTPDDITLPAPEDKDTIQQSQDHAESAAYRVIGSFRDAYILVEQGDDLLIVDQHAAHERLLYDQLTCQKVPASQALLAPYVLSVSHAQKNLIDENINTFTALGFDIQPFGVMEYKIGAVPSVFYGADVAELITDALDEISGRGGDIVLRREKIITASCKSAVKAGDRLNEEELQTLIDQFLQTDVIPTCPHGRPVITRITKKQLDKSFKRIL